jgi:hypothetical protein
MVAIDLLFEIGKKHTAILIPPDTRIISDIVLISIQYSKQYYNIQIKSEIYFK